MNFKFDVHVPWDSLDMISYKVFQNGALPESCEWPDVAESLSTFSFELVNVDSSKPVSDSV